MKISRYTNTLGTRASSKEGEREESAVEMRVGLGSTLTNKGQETDIWREKEIEMQKRNNNRKTETLQKQKQLTKTKEKLQYGKNRNEKQKF